MLVLSGNPKLAPETANTTTAGFVLSPGGWAEGMHFSADWYKIKIDGGQALEMAQNVVNQCYDGSDSSKCAQITFGSPLPGQGAQSNITQVRAVYINQSPYETQGVDINWDYLMPLDKMFSGAKGSFSFRLEGTYSLKTLIVTGGREKDISGQTGGDQGFLSDFAAAPNFAGNLTMSYLNDPLTVTLQTRWVSAGRLDKQNPKLGPQDAGYNPNLTYSVSDSTVPSYYVLNLEHVVQPEVVQPRQPQRVVERREPARQGSALLGGLGGRRQHRLLRRIRKGVPLGRAHGVLTNPSVDARRKGRIRAPGAALFAFSACKLGSGPDESG